MEADPITQQKRAQYFAVLSLEITIEISSKYLQKKCCNNKIYSILILSDWCERLKCLINKKKTLTNEWA